MEEISYDCSAYESVDDKNLSWVTPQNRREYQNCLVVASNIH